MLEFIKDGSVLHTEDLQGVDPLTLETYSELLTNNKFLVFCILVCKDTRRVYLARNIINMRYTISGTINVYRLKDPATREEVKDVLYFEVLNNPLFLKIPSQEAVLGDGLLINEEKRSFNGNETKKLACVNKVEEDPSISESVVNGPQVQPYASSNDVCTEVKYAENSDTIDSTRDLIIKALFIGNELDLLCSIELQNKIFRGVECDFSFLDALLGGLIFLVCFVLLFFFIVCLFYILLKFTFLS